MKIISDDINEIKIELKNKRDKLNKRRKVSNRSKLTMLRKYAYVSCRELN